MKKIFPLIIALITVSLIGIILIQVSWIKSMIVVEEKQFNDKLVSATRTVGEELAQYKGNMLSQGNSGLPWKQDQFTLDMLRPTTVASRFTAAQLNDKIRKAFEASGLSKIRFEFALASTNPYGEVTYLERQSGYFGKFYEDSASNLSCIYPIEPMSGSIGENLSPREILWVIVPNSSGVVLKELRGRILIAGISTIVFT